MISRPLVDRITGWAVPSPFWVIEFRSPNERCGLEKRPKCQKKVPESAPLIWRAEIYYQNGDGTAQSVKQVTALHQSINMLALCGLDVTKLFLAESVAVNLGLSKAASSGVKQPQKTINELRTSIRSTGSSSSPKLFSPKVENEWELGSPAIESGVPDGGRSGAQINNARPTSALSRDLGGKSGQSAMLFASSHAQIHITQDNSTASDQVIGVYIHIKDKRYGTVDSNSGIRSLVLPSTMGAPYCP
ncbi:hypothetical protein GGX14DRAFT_643134 [Mycena pura]|uniref:Uncharacterized protein n=1 Tax=Mycena pura TaxID=153505 RepID=A0AAD7E3C6_9AGAR|nr:hypothetical protein GGX14DRAFT_643134 [Mycena pura]